MKVYLVYEYWGRADSKYLVSVNKTYAGAELAAQDALEIFKKKRKSYECPAGFKPKYIIDGCEVGQ